MKVLQTSNLKSIFFKYLATIIFCLFFLLIHNNPIKAGVSPGTNAANCGQVTISQVRSAGGKTKVCYYNGFEDCLDTKITPVTFNFSNVTEKKGNPYNGELDIRVNSAVQLQGGGDRVQISNGSGVFQHHETFDPKSHRMEIYNSQGIKVCDFHFTVKNNCEADECNPQKGEYDADYDPQKANPFILCSQVADLDKQSECMACSHTHNGIWTAIGCIPTDIKSIVTVIIKIAMSLAIAFVILIIFVSSLIISTSQGEPNKLTEAKDHIVSAVIGLLFLVFSIAILEFIGIELFHIPGFGT